jgi:hypothetical protein
MGLLNATKLLLQTGSRITHYFAKQNKSQVRCDAASA